MMDTKNDTVIIGNVFRTCDYSKFKRLKGNRAVLANRVSRIMQSICKHGYITNPIVVNENFEIIDGQGRFEALRQLELPVDYIVAYGTGVKQCIALNAYGGIWTMNDYIDSYCEGGNENYLRLRSLMNAYPKLPLKVISQFAFGLCSTPSDKIKQGNIELPEDLIPVIEDHLRFVSCLWPSLSKVKGTNVYYSYAVGFARICGANEDRLISCVQRSDLAPAPNIRIALDNISDLYNWALKDQTKRIYLYPRYEETMCDKYGWYKAKWGTRNTDA